MARFIGSSVIDFLNNIGQDSSFSRRAQLAVQYGIVSNESQYTGSGDQNTRLLNVLRGQQATQSVPQLQPKSIFGTKTTTPTTTFIQPSTRPVQPPSPQPTRQAIPSVQPAQTTQPSRSFPDGTVFKFPDSERYFIKKGDQLIISFVSPGVFGDAPKDFGPEWAPNAVQITREELAKYGNFRVTSIQTPNMLRNLGGIPNPVPAPAFYQQAPVTPPSGQGTPEIQKEQPGADIFAQMGTFYKELYGVLSQFLGELQKRGHSINPTIPITPERVAEFMRQAQSDIKTFMPYVEKEILPYYETQLKLGREGFLKSLGYTQQELLRSEADVERKYNKTIKQIGEQAAEQGFALSGIRQREEQQTAEEAQRQIEAERRRFAFEAGTKAGEFAQKFGTTEVPTQNIQAVPSVTLEGFERGLAGGGRILGQPKPGQELAEQPVYALSPEVYSGLIGEKEFEKRAALRSRAAELEQAFRTEQAIGQQRKIAI